MPVTILGNNEGNHIDLSSSFIEKCSGSINFIGSNSSVIVEDPSSFGSIYCTISSGAHIKIGKNMTFNHLSIHALADGASITIGANVSLNGTVDINAHEGKRIEIGDDCLIASETLITVSDVHKIFDAKTGDRLNAGANVTIGPRVWIAARAIVLKDTIIGSDCVVGAYSVVSGTFEAGSLIVGAPARTARKGIRWER